MPLISRKHTSAGSPSSSHHHRSQNSSSIIDAATFSSQSTAPTSVSSGSPRMPACKTMPAPAGNLPKYGDPSRPRSAFQPSHQAYMEDLSPSTLCYPRDSVDTYVSHSDSDSESDSDNAIDDIFDTDDDDDDDDDSNDDCGNAHSHKRNLHSTSHKARQDSNVIPPLPDYHPDICGGINSMHYSTTPQEFAKLFPSRNRMSVRHDETTTDGNMNLRVDITVPVGERRRLTSYQLFHLRMYDLTKREFSLRRYSRDSGREVCNSKLNFIDPSDKKGKMAGMISRKSHEDENKHAPKHAPKHWGRSSTGSGHSTNSGSSTKTAAHSLEQRPSSLQRSVTTALRSLTAMASAKPPFRRPHSFDHPQHQASSHSPYAAAVASKSPAPSSGRPSLSSSTPSFFVRDKGRLSPPPPPPAPKPTNTIKLEFSNYARVDLVRVGGASASPASHGHGHDNTRYEFEWWGHKYMWKRTTDRLLNTVSYHLMRDDRGDKPIAHIVPEVRSPNQIEADEEAGGWIPPCHMWISDASVLEAQTDVADVIISTGLLSLTDDCIRMRWQPKATSHTSHGFSFDMEHVGPRALIQHVFRRNSSGSGSSNANASPYMSSPLRHAEPVY